ncbi:MAG: phospholipid carrier-dependent glycosyltransferase [Actinomycetota bacterium]
MSTAAERLNRPVVAIVAVGVLAALIRLWGLSHPQEMIFDENYYAEAACILIGGSDRECQLTEDAELQFRDQQWDVGSWVHPQLGKWMIAVGEKVFGVNAFGWRVSSAVAGTAVAVIAAVIAQILFGSAIWTFVTGGLVAIESLNVVMSRVALLDVFVELWVALGILFLLLDRRWIERRTPPEHGGVPSPLWRPWRYAAGFAMGAAFSSKWSGVLGLVAAVILTYAWETTRRRREGEVPVGRAFGRAFAQETLGVLLGFALLPALVYLLTWVPWFHHFGWSLSDWWEHQTAMLSYHRSLTELALDAATGTYTPTHPYYSHAWQWLPMIRPVNFYSPSGDGTIRQIIAIGNPAVFWGTIWTIPYALFAWRRKLDWRAGAIAVPFLAQYLPWFFVSRPQFFFYILPATPFMVLAATYSMRDLWGATIVLRDPETGARVESRRHPYRPFVYGYLAVAVALFLWFWPVLTGQELTTTLWRTRIWFQRWG